MLKNLKFKSKISKEDYKTSLNKLEEKINQLQREAKDLKIPILLVFEGWDAAGKGTIINQLLLMLDPRGFDMYSINPSNEEEKKYPFLQPFWIKTPVRGRIAVYEKSWYRRVLNERIEKTITEKECQKAYSQINNFEKQLSADQSIIIKFFLHISKNEQEKRMEKIQKEQKKAWQVMKKDVNQNNQYEQYFNAMEEMLEKTNTTHAQWYIIDAHDKKSATIQVLEKTAEVLEKSMQKIKKHQFLEEAKILLATNHAPILSQIDLTLSLEEKKYKKKLKECQKRIRELEYELYLKQKPLLILYEGWDAAGKGGNIRRFTQNLDPRGYQVFPISAPNDWEKSHHYLWRFWRSIPKAGHIAIFDRTWYGRVLVERVESFCTEKEWQRAYQEIKEMEEHLVEFGAILVKFWLHIDQDEQLKRFQERQENPAKQWKITAEDWRNREKWSAYETAVNNMLFHTSTPYASWTIIESNCKYYARIKALETIIEKVEQALR